MSSEGLTSVQDKFDVKDFVGVFSEKLIAQSKADAGRTYKESSTYFMLIASISLT
jgi:hypothetical protein